MQKAERVTIQGIDGATYTAVRSKDARTPNRWALTDPIRLLDSTDGQNFIDADGNPYRRI